MTFGRYDFGRNGMLALLSTLGKKYKCRGIDMKFYDLTRVPFAMRDLAM